MATTKREVTKVLEPELLSAEDQALLQEAHGDLRGSTKIIAGSLDKVVGKLRRPNALVRPQALVADLQLIRDQADAAIAAIGKLAS